MTEIGSAAQNFAIIKFPAAFLIGTAEWMFGVDNVASMKMLAMLILFDLLTAMGAAFKTGNAIESRKALKTVSKTVVYSMFAAAAHMTGVIMDAQFIAMATISFLAVTELISIVENIGKMGYAIPNKLLNKLSELRDK